MFWGVACMLCVALLFSCCWVCPLMETTYQEEDDAFEFEDDGVREEWPKARCPGKQVSDLIHYDFFAIQLFAVFFVC